jgi:hypothetical protein
MKPYRGKSMCSQVQSGCTTVRLFYPLPATTKARREVVTAWLYMMKSGGFESEKARRLYEELTPPPSESSAWILIVTYAGFLGESDLLESIYQRALAGRRVDTELECYENDELFIFWSHTPRQPWQDERYYQQQRKILRPAQFSRLHENQWVSSESRFIDPAIWDQNVLPRLRPDVTGALFIGIDASVKHDTTALVCVKYDTHSDNLGFSPSSHLATSAQLTDGL